MIYRRYTIPSAWEEMARMSKLVKSFTAERSTDAAFPAINAWTTEDEEVISAELPGVSPSDIELTIVNEVLTISGERKPVEVDGEMRYHRRERAAGKFSRSIQLSFPVASDQVNAHYQNGTLTVTLPRAEDDKPRKIAVKTL